MVNEIKKKQIYYGIASIAIFVLAVVGGSYAYFTAKGSSNENAVTSTASQLSLGYTDNTTKLKTDLIPSASSVVMKYAKEGTCKDANGYSVCSRYEFTVKNTSDVEVQLGAILKPNINTFTNLKYRVYETTTIEDTNLIGDTKSLTKDDGNEIYIEGINKKLAKEGTVTYTILMWVEETNGDQTETDSGKDFAATVSVYAYLPGTSSSDHNNPSGGNIGETEVPTANALTINNGDYQTPESNVELDLTSTGAEEVCITTTNDPSSCTENTTTPTKAINKVVATPMVEDVTPTILTNNAWTEYTDKEQYTLDTTTEGEKTIYAFYKNKAGISAGVSSSIIYSQEPYFDEEHNLYYYQNGKYEQATGITASFGTYDGYYDENLDKYYLNDESRTEITGFYINDGRDMNAYYNENSDYYLINYEGTLYEYNYNGIDTNTYGKTYVGYIGDNFGLYYDGTLYQMVTNEFTYYYDYVSGTNTDTILADPINNGYSLTVYFTTGIDNMPYYYELSGGYMEYYNPSNGRIFNQMDIEDSNLYWWLESGESSVPLYDINNDTIYFLKEITDDSRYQFFCQSEDSNDCYVEDISNSTFEHYTYDESSNMYYNSENDSYLSKEGLPFESTKIEGDDNHFYTYDSSSNMYISTSSYNYQVDEVDYTSYIYYDGNGTISIGKFYYRDETNNQFIEIVGD